jgi:hypothetical protein
MPLNTNEDLSQILGLIVAICYGKIREIVKSNKDIEKE